MPEIRGFAIIISLVSVVLLAGCSGKDAPAVTTDDASVVVKQDAAAGDVGTLEGTITDDSLAPLARAQVGLDGLDVRTITNDAGRFVFEKIPPKEYVLLVNALGYESIAKRISISAGETSGITLMLRPLFGAESFVSTVLYKGLINCGVGLVVIASTSSCGAADYEVATDTEVTYDVTTMIDELVWQATTAFSAQRLQITMGVNEDCTSFCEYEYDYGIVEGTSPVRLRADAPLDPISDGVEDTLYTVRHRVWTPFQSPDPPFIIVVLEQPFTIYSSMFYGAPAPEIFSAIPDG